MEKLYKNCEKNFVYKKKLGGANRFPRKILSPYITRLGLPVMYFDTNLICVLVLLCLPFCLICLKSRCYFVNGFNKTDLNGQRRQRSYRHVVWTTAGVMLTEMTARDSWPISYEARSNHFGMTDRRL